MYANVILKKKHLLIILTFLTKVQRKLWKTCSNNIQNLYNNIQNLYRALYNLYGDGSPFNKSGEYLVLQLFVSCLFFTTVPLETACLRVSLNPEMCVNLLLFPSAA